MSAPDQDLELSETRTERALTKLDEGTYEACETGYISDLPSRAWLG